MLDEIGLLGMAKLDQVAAETYCCTNLITLERFQINSKQVEEVIDDDSNEYMLLVMQADGEWEQVDPNDRFRIGLYRKRGTGQLYLHSGGGPEKAMAWSVLCASPNLNRIAGGIPDSTADDDE